MIRKISLSAVLLSSIFVNPVIATQYSLVPLGDLEGGDLTSIGSALNQLDVATGRSSSTNNQWQAFSWSSSGGMQGIGFLPGGNYTWAYGINDQGNIVGWGSSPNGTEAFYWSSANGMQGLGDLPGGTYRSAATDINLTDQVVGNSVFSTQDLIKSYEDPLTGEIIEYTVTAEYNEAFIWDSANGMIGLGVPVGAEASSATSINNDGVVTVATSTYDPDGEYFIQNEGYIWDAVNGFTGLGDLPGGDYASVPYDINNVSQVVGSSWVLGGKEAFIWDATNGIQSLGELPGGNWTAANAINDDGIVVGTGVSTNGSQMSDGWEGFLWQAETGIVSLNSLVDETANGWFLSGATDINNNGVILGYGFNPLGNTEAFLLMPLPPIINADLAVTQYDNPDPINEGDATTYTVTVTNNGPYSAAGVVLDSVLPKDITFVSATSSQGNCEVVTGPVNKRKNAKLVVVGVNCALGDLVSGSAATADIVVRLNNADNSNTHFVSVHSDVNDEDLSNNTASETTTVESNSSGKPTCKGKDCNK